MKIFEDENGLKVKTIGDKAGHVYNLHDRLGTINFLQFQDGNIPDNGVNGVTNEALLTILIHRTSTLDRKFPCNENKCAIKFMKDALEAFNIRTLDRVERKVKGKYKL